MLLSLELLLVLKLELGLAMLLSFELLLVLRLVLRLVLELVLELAHPHNKLPHNRQNLNIRFHQGSLSCYLGTETVPSSLQNTNASMCLVWALVLGPALMLGLAMLL